MSMPSPPRVAPISPSDTIINVDTGYGSGYRRAVTIDIRRVHEDELPAYVETLTTSFLERPDVDKVAAEVAPLWRNDRVWAAFEEDGRVRGTFRSWATELTVPGGGRLPAAGVAGVTVMPTHRRRGILRRMVGAEHRAIREHGDAVGLLYASEFPIYGRFGYGPATRVATWTLDALVTGFAGRELVGSVDVVKPDDAAREAIKLVFEAWRLRQPGEIRRRDYRWAYDLGRESAFGERWKGFLALHRDASGAVDGYVRYRTEEKWERRQARAIAHVDELHALTHEAYVALWRFLAELDLVATVKAEGRSPAERLPWLLTNFRAASVSDVGDGLWVRLFDVPRALAARRYDHEAEIVLEVVDDEAPGGRVCVELATGLDGASCRVTERSPDLTLGVASLGAAYLGGIRLRDAVLATGADEHRPRALADADRIFRTLDEPWCSTFF